MSKQTQPALVVFGKKGPKLPHAARFDLSDARVAQWVAEQHRMSLLRVDAEMMRKGLGSLPSWGLTKDGQPLIPTVTLNTLDLLLQLKAEAAATGAAGPAQYQPRHRAGRRTRRRCGGPSPARRGRPRAVGALAVDSLVLAPEQDAGHGWWEAIILAVHDDTCTLCWRDFPQDGLFKRKRHDLALLPVAANAVSEPPEAGEGAP